MMPEIRIAVSHRTVGREQAENGGVHRLNMRRYDAFNS